MIIRVGNDHYKLLEECCQGLVFPQYNRVTKDLIIHRLIYHVSHGYYQATELGKSTLKIAKESYGRPII